MAHTVLTLNSRTVCAIRVLLHGHYVLTGEISPENQHVRFVELGSSNELLPDRVAAEHIGCEKYTRETQDQNQFHEARTTK